MFLIVGLGNIGKQYDQTPHNAGFMFVEQFLKLKMHDINYSIRNWTVKSKFQSDIAEIWEEQEKKIILAKPRTFMNRSGLAVASLCSFFNIDISKELILVHDDLDIQLGRFKIQRNRFPYGHKGVISVQRALPTTDFIYVRLGVDNRQKEQTNISGEEYVLKKFDKDELLTLNEVIVEAITGLNKVIV